MDTLCSLFKIRKLDLFLYRHLNYCKDKKWSRVLDFVELSCSVGLDSIEDFKIIKQHLKQI